MSTVSTPSPSQSVSLSPADSKTRVSEFMKQMQDKICQTLEHLDGRGKFQQDKWEREEEDAPLLYLMGQYLKKEE